MRHDQMIHCLRFKFARCTVRHFFQLYQITLSATQINGKRKSKKWKSHGGKKFFFYLVDVSFFCDEKKPKMISFLLILLNGIDKLNGIAQSEPLEHKKEQIKCTRHLIVCKLKPTLYRARLSRIGFCLWIWLGLAVAALELFATVVVAAATIGVVVAAVAVDDVEASAFDTVAAADVEAVAADDGAPGSGGNRLRFFNEPMDPFSKSGLSTSGPPNSCSCCNQQQSIASIPSST